MKLTTHFCFFNKFNSDEFRELSTLDASKKSTQTTYFCLLKWFEKF